MEIITGVEWRRPWRQDQKLQIVAATEQPGAWHGLPRLSARYEISRGVLGVRANADVPAGGGDGEAAKLGSAEPPTTSGPIRPRATPDLLGGFAAGSWPWSRACGLARRRGPRRQVVSPPLARLPTETQLGSEEAMGQAAGSVRTRSGADGHCRLPRRLAFETKIGRLPRTRFFRASLLKTRLY